MGDERAETYLRVLAEAKFWPVVQPPGWRRDLLETRPAGSWPEALMWLRNVGPEVLLPVASAGLILTAAGLLDDDFTERLYADMRAALMVRSPTLRRTQRRSGRAVRDPRPVLAATAGPRRPPAAAHPGPADAQRRQ